MERRPALARFLIGTRHPAELVARSLATRFEACPATSSEFATASPRASTSYWFEGIHEVLFELDRTDRFVTLHYCILLTVPRNTWGDIWRRGSNYCHRCPLLNSDLCHLPLKVFSVCLKQIGVSLLFLSNLELPFHICWRIRSMNIEFISIRVSFTN